MMQTNRIWRQFSAMLTTIFAIAILLPMAQHTDVSAAGLQQTTPPSPIVYTLPLPKLPYPSQFVTVNGYKMHYIEGGDPKGNPIVFVNGAGGWVYQWRNILPLVANAGRVIAIDPIGYGLSDKPRDLSYSLPEHANFLTGFIEELGLKDITFVTVDTGAHSVFAYAREHEANVKTVIFYDAPLPPRFPFATIQDNPAPEWFAAARTPGMAEEILMNQAWFIEVFVPFVTMRTLSEEELNGYRAPYPTPETRRAMWAIPNTMVVGGEPAVSSRFLDDNIAWLTETEVPFMQIYAEPGILGGPNEVAWVAENIDNVTQLNIGAGLQFLHEDHPEALAQAIITQVHSLVEPVDNYLRRTDVRYSYDDTPQPNAPAGIFTIRTTYKNVSELTLSQIHFVVKRLTSGNLLLNADAGDGGVGSILYITEMATLMAHEKITVEFHIGLSQRRPFEFMVAAYGLVDAEMHTSSTKMVDLATTTWQITETDFNTHAPGAIYLPLIASE